MVRVRIGTSNIQVDDEWLRRFAVAAGGGAELLGFDQNYKNYFSGEQIVIYLKAVKEKRGNVYKGMTSEEVLAKLRAVAKEHHPTLFGLLAFSNDFGLQELTAPTVDIAVTQYKGTSKVNPSDVAEVSLDDKEFTGNVAKQFDGALKFIMSKLPIRSRVETGGKRAEYMAIPELAIRETLANALVHPKHNPTGINNNEYRELNNMTDVGDDRKAKRELVRMVDTGLLRKLGARRNRKYIALGEL